MSSIRCQVASAAHWVVRNLAEVFSVKRFEFVEWSLDCVARLDLTFVNSLYDWQIAAHEDVRELLQDNELSGSVTEDFLQRFDARHFDLYVAREVTSHAIVAYIAYATRSKRLNNSTHFVVKQSECIIGPYYTKVLYRGQDCVTQGTLKILNAERDAGKATAYADIARSNRSSNRVVAKTGGRQTESGYFLVRVFKQDFVIPFGNLSPQCKNLQHKVLDQKISDR